MLWVGLPEVTDNPRTVMVAFGWVVVGVRVIEVCVFVALTVQESPQVGYVELQVPSEDVSALSVFISESGRVIVRL